MSKLLILLTIIFVACSQNKKGIETSQKNKYVSLRTDTLNVVKLSDTLIIYEGTCRGCAYEGSTSFNISDSTGSIVLDQIKSTDNNSPDMNGGNISKNLILIPKKTGTISFIMYKFFKPPTNAEDSAKGATTYKLQINQ